MHAALRDNHPAAVVPGDASAPFRAWLDAGLQQAQAKAGQVNSGDSHAYLLRWYANGFRDSNIAARPTYEGLGPFFATSWPGVATAWRNGQYVVSYVQEGVRGAPPADIDALAETLAALSRFAAANAGGIESIDLNPLRVLERGKGVVALDALIVPRGADLGGH